MALTRLAPVLGLLIFSNDERLGDKFDLPMFLRRFISRCEFSAALRTGFEFELDGRVDLFGSEEGRRFCLCPFFRRFLSYAAGFGLWGSAA